MTDQCRCCPKTQTQTDARITDRYRCSPKQKLKLKREWSIDIMSYQLCGAWKELYLIKWYVAAMIHIGNFIG